jgi:hypothetical protein
VQPDIIEVRKVVLPKTQIEIDLQELKYRETVPLGRSAVTIRPAGSSAPQDVPVALEYIGYDVCYRVPQRDGLRAVSGQLTLYRLHSTDDAKAFEWWFSSLKPGYGFHIVTDAANTPYLTWSRWGAAELADISRPRSMVTALDERFSVPEGAPQRGITAVPVLKLVGRAPLTGLDALNYEIHVLSVKCADAGDWEVQVCGVALNTVFTFVSHGDQWSLKGTATALPAAK